MSKHYRHWTAKDKAKFIALYPNTTSKELARIFNRKESSIGATAQRFGVKKSQEYLEKHNRGHFKKGDVPWNKGLSYMPNNADTRFQKGHTKAERHPVGTIVKRTDRINEFIIKVSDDGDRKQNWRPLAEHVWIQAGNEPPNENELIRFKDNYIAKSAGCYTADRLEKLTRSENLKLNSIMRYPVDLRVAMQTLGRLKKANEQRRETT